MVTNTTASVGHKIVSKFVVKDTNGNPMVTPPAFDSPPDWKGDTPATETLSVSADGATATWTAVAAGTNNVTLTLTVGGKTYTANAVHTVTADAQEIGSVEIVETVE